MRRAVRMLIALAVVVLLFVVVWFTREFRSVKRELPAGAYFELEKGQGVRSVTGALEKAGLIRSPLAFRLAYRLYYPHQSLKAGEYDFSKPVTMRDILEALTKGRIHLRAVTVPEGLTGEEIADVLIAAGLVRRDAFLAAFDDIGLVASWDRDAVNLEGYLFPETYDFAVRTPAAEVVGRMVAQFESVFTDAWRRRARELGLSVRQVTILASLIEKETSRPEEKKLVSAVFHNRLQIHMKLDCDPTIIYALKLAGGFEGRLRSRDLKLESPYNTYLHAGLPPGPISNPGRDSLEAALYPADEDYLYFVSRNDGTHQFSRTLREHQIAVSQYRDRARH